MARSAADRKAEAARYRQKTEEAMAHNYPTVPLDACQYVKEERTLKLSSANIGMPEKLYIRSNHTGRTVLFQRIGESHPYFDYDQWDGEQQVYEPVEPDTKVNLLIIANFY